jgi:hypothetical protein
MRNQIDQNGRVLRFNLDQNLFESNMNAASARMAYNESLFSEQAAGAGYRIAMRQAQIDQMAGLSQAYASRLQGYAAAADGLTSMTNTAMNYSYRGGSRYVNTSTSPGGRYNPNASVRRATPIS